MRLTNEERDEEMKLIYEARIILTEALKKVEELQIKVVVFEDLDGVNLNRDSKMYLRCTKYDSKLSI